MDFFLPFPTTNKHKLNVSLCNQAHIQQTIYISKIKTNAISYLLLCKDDLGLSCVAVEHLQRQRLAEQLLPVLPHLLQLGPAVLQRLEPLAQEHVLRVVLRRRLRRDLLAVLHHLAVVLGVVVDLFTDALMLSEQLLCLGQRGRRVLRRDVGLGLSQPRLKRIFFKLGL